MRSLETHGVWNEITDKSRRIVNVTYILLLSPRDVFTDVLSGRPARLRVEVCGHVDIPGPPIPRALSDQSS